MAWQYKTIETPADILKARGVVDGKDPAGNVIGTFYAFDDANPDDNFTFTTWGDDLAPGSVFLNDQMAKRVEVYLNGKAAVAAVESAKADATVFTPEKVPGPDSQFLEFQANAKRLAVYRAVGEDLFSAETVAATKAAFAKYADANPDAILQLR